MLCPSAACAAVTSRWQVVRTSFWESKKEKESEEVPGVEPAEARKRFKSLTAKLAGMFWGQSQHPNGEERAREGRRVARRDRKSMLMDLVGDLSVCRVR